MTRRLLAMAGVLLLLGSVCSQPLAQQGGQATNKARLGQWADNGEVRWRVLSVAEIPNWGGLPFSKRYTPAQARNFEHVKKSVDAQQAKVIAVAIEMKNTSTTARRLGYDCFASVGGFYIRGDEGSEQYSGNTNWFGKDITVGTISPARKLPFFLTGTFPQDAQVSPGGEVKGKLFFVVPSWFTPVVAFTKPYSRGLCMGKMEMIIRLK